MPSPLENNLPAQPIDANVHAEDTAASANSEKRRIILLDEIRGFAVICMVVYHSLYSLGYIFDYSWAVWLFEFFTPLQPFFASLFIFISGFCAKLTRSNLRRGAILLVIAVLVNIFTIVFLPSNAIIFGVLNLLSICMLLAGLYDKLSHKLPPLAGLIASVALYLFTYGIANGYFGIFTLPLISIPDSWYQIKLLYPLGIRAAGMYSSDYFPLLPWVFVFAAGMFFGEMFLKHTHSEFIYKSHVPPFSAIGRHALWIYILHQPVVFAFAYAVYGIHKLFA